MSTDQSVQKLVETSNQLFEQSMKSKEEFHALLRKQWAQLANPILLDRDALDERTPNNNENLNFFSMFLTGINVFLKDGKVKQFTSATNAPQVVTKDVERVVARYGTIDVEPVGDDCWVVHKFTKPCEHSKPKVIAEALEERARAALVLVEHAIQSGYTYVSFDPTTDPVNRRMLAMACDYYGLDYDDTPGVEVNDLPNIDPLLAANRNVKDRDKTIEGYFQDAIRERGKGFDHDYDARPTIPDVEIIPQESTRKKSGRALVL